MTQQLMRQDTVSPKKSDSKWVVGTLIKFNMDEDEALVLTNTNKTIWIPIEDLELTIK